MGDEDRRIVGDRMKRYRLSYGGEFLGSYETAKEALHEFQEHNRLIRPIIDKKRQWHYRISDGPKEITMLQLQAAADKE